MMDDLSTVFRSGERNGDTEANAIKNMLVTAGMHASIEEMSGGVWEVRVPAADLDEAQALIASSTPDTKDDLDPSSELDFVTVANTEGAMSEMEAVSIQSVLDANGINAVVVGASSLPNLGFQIKVSREDADKAQRAIDEARAAGPAAAAEGASQSESER